MDLRDERVVAALLKQPGRWMIHVHQGHIVKVARVEAERSAAELDGQDCRPQRIDSRESPMLESGQLDSSP